MGMLLYYSYHPRGWSCHTAFGQRGQSCSRAVVFDEIPIMGIKPTVADSRICLPQPRHFRVIMPLRSFSVISDPPTEQLPHSVHDIGRTMLPAARGLEAMHNFGLVHQDVHSLNVALYMDNRGGSLVYWPYWMNVKKCLTILLSIHKKQCNR